MAGRIIICLAANLGSILALTINGAVSSLEVGKAIDATDAELSALDGAGIAYTAAPAVVPTDDELVAAMTAGSAPAEVPPADAPAAPEGEAVTPPSTEAPTASPDAPDGQADTSEPEASRTDG